MNLSPLDWVIVVVEATMLFILLWHLRTRKVRTGPHSYRATVQGLSFMFGGLLAGALAQGFDGPGPLAWLLLALAGGLGVAGLARFWRVRGDPRDVGRPDGGIGPTAPPPSQSG